jgi:hypothetical protein
MCLKEAFFGFVKELRGANILKQPKTHKINTVYSSVLMTLKQA